MRRKITTIMFFVLFLILSMPCTIAEAKTRLAKKEKTMITGRTYCLKLKGVEKMSN